MQPSFGPYSHAATTPNRTTTLDPAHLAPAVVDAEFARIVNELTRRGFLVGGTAAAALLGLAACGDNNTTAGPSMSDKWSFTDDRGNRIDLPRRPKRIVAFIDCAAALASYGIEAIGYFGATIGPDPRNGTFETTDATPLGTTEVNLEKLAALQPDLVVTNSWFANGSPNVILDHESKVSEVAPVAVISMLHRDVSAIVARYGQLAASLGADTSKAPEAKAGFDAACAAVRRAAGPGLRVIETYNHNDAGVWVADPDYWPFTQTLAELGLTMQRPGKANGDPVILISWENIGSLQADVILNQDPTLASSDQPTWRRLPAVQANQVISQDTGWYCFTYPTYARLLTQLAQSLGGFRRLG